MINFVVNKKAKLACRPSWLKLIARNFSRVAKIKGNAEVSLAIVGDAEMRRLNRVYRNKDKTTDVLSFAESGEKFVSGDRQKSLGEIVISASQLKRQAKEFAVSEDGELARLLVHGLAHLIGLDHERVSEKEAKKMESFEAKVLAGIFPQK